MGRGKSHDQGIMGTILVWRRIFGFSINTILKWCWAVLYKALLDHVHWHSCTYLFIFCDRSWRHHGLSQSHNPDKPKTMTIKNFLFSTVPNILYELGASAKVGSLAKWVNKFYNTATEKMFIQGKDCVFVYPYILSSKVNICQKHW